MDKWHIKVFRGLSCLDDFHVPKHRLSDRAVKDLLKAVIVRFEKLDLEELTLCYLNKRKGKPKRSLNLKVISALDLEKAKDGYCVFGPTISAFALYEISPEIVKFLRENIDKK